jgi:transcriptional regulator with XRE-family HTH domain
MAKTRTITRLPDGGDFGKFVRQLRRARGMTQEALAERAGVSADTVRRLEKSEFSPSLDTLRKLTRGLRIDLSSLFLSFELGEVGSARELVSMASALSRVELDAAIRTLAVLVDLLSGVRMRSETDGQVD